MWIKDIIASESWLCTVGKAVEGTYPVPIREPRIETHRRRSAKRKKKGKPSPTETRLRKHLVAAKFVGGVTEQMPFKHWRLDFVLPHFRVVIEVDGPEHRTTAGRAADHIRDSELTYAGFQVFRVTNARIWAEIESVMADICERLVSTQGNLCPVQRYRDLWGRLA